MTQPATPTWWYTHMIRSPTNNNIHILFEYFPRNAEPHALLRLTVSGVDDSETRESTISRDQLVTTQRITPTAFIALITAPTTNFTVVHHTLHIRNPPNSDIHLPLQHPIPPNRFVSRIADYLTHAEAQFQHDRNNVSILRSKNQHLATRVQQLLDQKLSEDKLVKEGLQLLLSSKKNH